MPTKTPEPTGKVVQSLDGSPDQRRLLRRVRHSADHADPSRLFAAEVEDNVLSSALTVVPVTHVVSTGQGEEMAVDIVGPLPRRR